MRRSWREVFQEKVVPLFISLSLGLAMLILAWGMGWVMAIASLILTTILSFIAVDWWNVMTGKINILDELSYLRQKIDDAVNKKLEYISMLEHAALYTNRETFLNTLKLLQGQRDAIRWIIAKFISKKLTTDFTKLQFNISGEEYSNFASTLYPECKESIYLTSPYTPGEWFTLLCKDEYIQRLYRGNRVGDDCIPKHVKSLKLSNAPIKRRLVILPTWEALLGQERLFHEFLRINSPVEHRFALQHDLLRKLTTIAINECGCDLLKYDYAIFDKKILL